MANRVAQFSDLKYGQPKLFLTGTFDTSILLSEFSEHAKMNDLVGNSNPHVVVLGGGPAGLSAAWRLSELKFRVTVVERNGSVGGMSRTISLGASGDVDLGPHTFHIRKTKESEAVRGAIHHFFGPNPLVLSRGTRVLLRDKYFVYPLELLQVLRGVPLSLSLRIVSDYLKATIKAALLPPKKEDSFEEWGVRNLGRTLYDLCFGVYSERVWGLPTGQISSKQAQRVAKLNLKNIILRTLGIKADPASHFTEYLYPRKGISVLFEAMCASVNSNGNKVLLNSSVTRVERKGSKVCRVAYVKDKKEEFIDCDIVLSTLPLPALVESITPKLPEGTIAHASRLRYRSLKLIYITLNRSALTDWHWVYLLDEKFRINRVSEQKNVSPTMVASDRTILCIELSLWNDEPLWLAPKEDVYRIALTDIMKMGFGIKESEVLEYSVFDLPSAYPVYELGFEEHLLPVLDAVHSMDNLLTLGRHGLFLNNSMDDNVLLGMKIADHIKKHNGGAPQIWKDEVVAFMNLRFAGK